jgi:hypothetical protein
LGDFRRCANRSGGGGDVSNPAVGGPDVAHNALVKFGSLVNEGLDEVASVDYLGGRAGHKILRSKSFYPPERGLRRPKMGRILSETQFEEDFYGPLLAL